MTAPKKHRQRARDADGRPDVTVAVAGCGYWGRNHVRVFGELGALAGVCDSDADTARGFAEAHGIAAWGWRELLAGDEVDAVVIASPAATHARLARQALEAGKHVLVEKPLALKVAEAEDLCRLADEVDRRLMVGHLLHYHPAFQRLKQMVGAGELGRVQYLYSNRLNLGKVRREEDILWSFAPHDISMMLALVGSEPDGVEASGAAYLHKTIADVTTTNLSFPGGAQGHIFVSWLHPFKEHKLVVIGDRCMAVFDDGQPWESKLRLYRHRIDWRDSLPLPTKAEPENAAVEPAEALRVECEHFIDCVRHGSRPQTDGTEGLRVLRVLDRATRRLNGSRERGGDRGARWTDVQVHETACIDDGVMIGPGSKVWHFSHILANSVLGREVVVGQNVMIGPEVHVGDRCKIQNNVSLYKGVTLERGVFCGPSCVFTNVLNPRAEVERKDEFRPTLVRRGATIGANATILCGTTLGRHCFVAAGAVVTRDVPDYALVAGMPARRVGWVSEAGERLGADLVCPRTGQRYREVGPDELVEVRDE